MKRPDTSRAARAFEDFTGRKPAKTRVERLDDGAVAGWEMGPLVGVAYEATRDGERARYFHEFAKNARPSLVAREDGRQLYIAGGRYRVTERGVEDMPNPLFVVNPSRRKGKAKMARRRTSTKRRAPAVVVVRQNPRRRKRRSNFLMNPRRRAPHRRAPARHKVRRYRRNPSLRGGSAKLMNLLGPAAGIALGAVVTEIGVGYLPLPAQLKTGTMLYVTKGAVGIAAGLVVGKMLRQPRIGKYIAAGAVVIAVHDAVKSLILKSMPSVKFGQFVDYAPYSRMHGLGYANPAPLIGPGGFGEFVPPIAHGMAGDGTGNNGGGGETNWRV